MATTVNYKDYPFTGDACALGQAILNYLFGGAYSVEVIRVVDSSGTVTMILRVWFKPH